MQLVRKDSPDLDGGDFRVTLKVNNANLARAFEAAGVKVGSDSRRGLTIPNFCRAHGINYVEVNRLMGLRLSPLDATGMWRPTVMKLAVALNRGPDQLFSEDQIEPLACTSVSFDADREELLRIQSGAPLPIDSARTVERIGLMDDLLGALKPRERAVIEARFGLDGSEKTLAAIGEQYGVQAQTIRMIEAKALRKLRGYISKIDDARADTLREVVVESNPRARARAERNEFLRERIKEMGAVIRMRETMNREQKP